MARRSPGPTRHLSRLGNTSGLTLRIDRCLRPVVGNLYRCLLRPVLCRHQRIWLDHKQSQGGRRHANGRRQREVVCSSPVDGTGVLWFRMGLLFIRLALDGEWRVGVRQIHDRRN